jgi:hypothetical protein
MALEHLAVFVAIFLVCLTRRVKEGGAAMFYLLWDDVIIAAIATAALVYVYRLEY